MTRAANLMRTIMLTLAWIVVAPCLVLLLSAIVPVVPWLRLYAFDKVPNYAPWMLVLSLTALAIGILAHARRATWLTCSMVATAAIATLAAGGVVTRFLYTAESNGARIYLPSTLSLRQYSEDAAPDESRVYANPQGEPLWLDIYRPRGSGPRRPGPVLVVIHGGGFVGGSRSIGAANMRRYADRGWIVISIDYRLARPDRPTWNLAIQDVRCALAWTAANAETLGIDIERLTLSGASAGGSLALAAAYTSGTRPYDAGCGSRVPRVAAVVVKAPLIDPVGSWDNPGELRDLQRSYLTRYVGGTPERYPARYAAIDLRRYVRPDNPPTLILAGADDPLLPATAAKDFTRQATNVGSQVRLVLFPYSGHDFNTTFESITNQTVMQVVAGFIHDNDLGPEGVPSRQADRTVPK